MKKYLIPVLIMLLTSPSFSKTVDKEKGPVYTKLKIPGPFQLSTPVQIPDFKKFNEMDLSSSVNLTLSSPQEISPLIIQSKITNATPLVTPATNTQFSLPELPPLATQDPDKTIHQMTPLDYKSLQAKIFTDIGRHELALGLYLDILKEVPAKQKSDIIKKLALSAKALDLYFDFKNWNLALLNDASNKDFALRELTLNIKNYDDDLVGELLPLLEKNKFIVPQEALQFRILAAQHLSRKDQLKEAFNWVEIPDLSLNEAPKAILLGAILLYRQGQVNKAIQRVESIYSKNFETLSSDLKNESYLLSGRLHFQKGDYLKAKNYYSKIEQNYIEWLPAMTEMGWAQILQGDYEGASGNMFSLHTDYFKNHFIPDSYLARTVGYLGLCQYGDAFKTVVDLKGRYEPLVEKTNSIKSSWNGEEYYELIKSALQNPKQPLINGVPREWISLLTRDPEFIREQRIVNSLEDEIQSYNKFTLKIIKSEKDAIEKKKSLLAKKSLNEKEKEDINWLNIQIHIYKKSREPMRSLRTTGLKRIDSSKEIHKKLAGLSLKKRMISTHQYLLTSFEQIDLLQYEIFAGAGDQLRSVISGLPIEARSFAGDKDTKEQVNVKWKFKGEVWKDEIGYFRSSLKNICPQDKIIDDSVNKGETP